MRFLGSPRRLTPPQVEIISGIRMELISNYMYLLSAPFLAIAMYYLLQVVATNTAEPIIVLMSFATGLVPDRIVRGIIRVAESALPDTQKAPEDEKVVDRRAPQDDATHPMDHDTNGRGGSVLRWDVPAFVEKVSSSDSFSSLARNRPQTPVSETGPAATNKTQIKELAQEARSDEFRGTDSGSGGAGPDADGQHDGG
jgi:hypothetical protein